MSGPEIGTLYPTPPPPPPPTFPRLLSLCTSSSQSITARSRKHSRPLCVSFADSWFVDMNAADWQPSAEASLEKQTAKHLQVDILWESLKKQEEKNWIRFGRCKLTSRTSKANSPPHRVCVLLYPVATHVNVAVLASNWTR